MKRHLASLLCITALAGGVPPVAAQADEPAVYEDGYGAGTYGRIRFVEPGVALLRADTTDDADRGGAAAINDAIFPGDSVRTGSDARAEVQLAAGTLVRVDRGTDVAFLSLPDPYTTVEDNTILDLSFGVIQLAAIVKERQEVRIDTPSATIYLLGNGDFRIEVASDGTTRVLSRRGVAEVNGDGASVLVRGGTRSVIAPGRSPEDARPFHTFASDSFDAWVASRSSAYERQDSPSSSSADAYAYDHVPVEVRPYYRELSNYGNWVDLPTYGYAWYPANAAPGWRPYLAGGWSYGPGGYFWVSSEPWGWAPYHYGRWTWASGYGWCWIPGSVFGGAWVSWSWGHSHVGWSALDYWNRPAYGYGYGYGYGHGHPSSWTFVGYSNFGSRDCGRYAVPSDSAGALLQTSAIVTRPPRVSPRVIAADPTARQRVVNELSANRGARFGADGARDRGSEKAFTDVERQRARPRVRPTAGSVGTPRTGTREGSAPVDRSPGRTPIVRSGAGPTPSSERERVRVPDRDRLRPSTERQVVKPQERSAPAPADVVPPDARSDDRGRQVQRRPPSRIPLGEISQPAPRDAPPTLVPQLREGQAANDHVRELYRRAAGPRVTGERGRAPAPPVVVPRRAAPAPPQPSPPATPPAATGGASKAKAPPPQASRPAPRERSAGGTRERQGRGGGKKK